MEIARLFREHPASVGESYVEHLLTAGGFALRMFAGGAACLLHALLPFLCVRTGSDCIAELNRRMVSRRREGAALTIEGHPGKAAPEALPR